MSAELMIRAAGPAMSLQDMGRQGYLVFGLTRGGAADRRALYEGAALLGQPPDCAAIEMVGMGGTFEATADTVIALTGARMTATRDGAPLVWNASHALPAGAMLVIGGAQAGTYGYLHVAGGFDAPLQMGARASHLNAGIGGLLQAGDALPLCPGQTARSGYFLTPEDRLQGGTVRVVTSFQSHHFSEETRVRFAETGFRRDPRGNRQGVRMEADGDGFFAEGGLSIVSEVITTGDIQVTGDGAPYVLMCESQTTGGYPRIGTVIPSDLPRVAQAAAGTALRFEFIDHDEAIAIETRARADIKALASRIQPLIRDPYDIADLLRYQLVGGVISATADPFET
ncbi:biotin-dependent carboxyltransferase family protein [Roseobacter sp. YSTF-M11]|uniref:Biotin-dependent carboxyltransferase family protein n=1 Tax=Roseobacter insulae TaxID=2859783 RepID=A0A9X1K065_9RHOB|nr:biotin-dependent carboxyltransferase family protein [Roseobacter insulae]MBW4706183.1 biotin-dependent carboxyltransferase family protein [Roseobacter insulae]